MPIRVIVLLGEDPVNAIGWVGYVEALISKWIAGRLS